MGYKIKLEIFEGPLDLLLYLVKKNHLNIYDIPIAAVTDQYLQYLNLMQLLDLNIAGEFMVMAATLMQIKSKMLLPVDEDEASQDEEEDPRAELVQRLLEYEKFKEAANSLREKEIQQRELFKRPRSERPRELVSDTGGQKYFEANIFDLINAFSQALKDVPKEVFYEVVKDEFTISEKIHSLLHLMLIKPSVKLSELFAKTGSKMELIVTFLAVLELVKMREIIAFQREMFQEIELSRNTNNIVPDGEREQADAS
ncbi:MAG: segregation/condensation protein A [Candidatus Omnitrophica bacterium]|nr:segregation/condensation protein A [Candidatus Omnitrophota bacterium]